MQSTFHIIAVTLGDETICWEHVTEVKAYSSIDRFLNELNKWRGLFKNILVLEEGCISRNYSRLTSEAVSHIQNLRDYEFLPLLAQVPQLIAVTAPEFAAHARRTWPPGGDGERVVKRPRRR